jgi:hypothetical protein
MTPRSGQALTPRHRPACPARKTTWPRVRRALSSMTAPGAANTRRTGSGCFNDARAVNRSCAAGRGLKEAPFEPPLDVQYSTASPRRSSYSTNHGIRTYETRPRGRVDCRHRCGGIRREPHIPDGLGRSCRRWLGSSAHHAAPVEKPSADHHGEHPRGPTIRHEQVTSPVTRLGSRHEHRARCDRRAAPSLRPATNQVTNGTRQASASGHHITLPLVTSSALNGSTTGRRKYAKCRTLRIASVARRATTMPAICVSRRSEGRPTRCRVAVSSAADFVGAAAATLAAARLEDRDARDPNGLGRLPVQPRALQPVSAIGTPLGALQAAVGGQGKAFRQIMPWQGGVNGILFTWRLTEDAVNEIWEPRARTCDSW